MGDETENLYGELAKRALEHGIFISRAELADDVPGEFDGPTITLHARCGEVESAFYLAHSLGSIAEWSLHFERTRGVFSELERAKRDRTVGSGRADGSGRIARAVADYLSFENRTWEFAAWLLEDSGHDAMLPALTNFGRADMEAMRIHHTTGKAPVWREFFAQWNFAQWNFAQWNFPQWNEEAPRGLRKATPLTSRPIPCFQAIRIPKQEIVQENDSEAD